MENEKQKRKKIITILIGIILIIIVVIAFVILMIKQNQENTDSGKASLESNYIEEANNQANLEALYDMTEQERITYYCAEFFKLVNTKNYDKAYELLYDEYKENYFPTKTSFSEYMKEYFPDDFSLNYTNFERLGDIYVLWVDVKDTLNGFRGHNFSMYVVIKENDFDNFVLSFSRNSAVEEE